MNKIFQILSIAILFAGCATIPQGAKNNDWIYGNWLTVSVTESIVKYHKIKRNAEIEKHILIFMRDGELRRYSEKRGLIRLLIDFRVEGDIVMMHPHTEKKFFPLAKKLEDGKLELLVPNGRYIYVKLDDNINIIDLDLSGSPEVEVTDDR